MTAIARIFKDARTPTSGVRVAVSHSTRRYATWVHAAYERGYDGCSPTLCGKRFADPLPEARGAPAWEVVTCTRCLSSIAKLEANK